MVYFKDSFSVLFFGRKLLLWYNDMMFRIFRYKQTQLIYVISSTFWQRGEVLIATNELPKIRRIYSLLRTASVEWKTHTWDFFFFTRKMYMYSTLSYFKRGKRLKSISFQYIIEECGYFIVLFPTLNVKKNLHKNCRKLQKSNKQGIVFGF